LRTVEKIGSGYEDTRNGVVLPTFLHTKWGLFPITVLVFSAVFLFSSTAPLEKSFAEELYASVFESISFTGPLDVFAHNLALSIIMMIPVVGFGFSIITSSTTGVAVSAVSTLRNLNPLSLAIGLLSTPSGILEFLAYGLASAQGLAGLFAMVEKRVKKELRGYVTTILIVGGLLLAAAFVETVLTIVPNI